MKIAFIDFETTGLDSIKDEIIDGAVAVAEGAEEDMFDGGVKRVSWRLVDGYESLNQPIFAPIPAKITRLTGITDDMVAGKKIDWAKFKAVADTADLAVAYNAKFDRGFMRHHGGFDLKKWGCAMTMIDWSAHGYNCIKLPCLARDHAIQADRSHRAMWDAMMMMKLILFSENSQAYLSELMDGVSKKWVQVAAVGAPFSTKDKLKANGFFWNDATRVWCKNVQDTEAEQLSAWIAKEIVGRVSYRPIMRNVDPTL